MHAHEPFSSHVHVLQPSGANAVSPGEQTCAHPICVQSHVTPSSWQAHVLQPSSASFVAPGAHCSVQPIAVHAHCPSSPQVQLLHPSPAGFVSPSTQAASHAISVHAQVPFDSQKQVLHPSEAVAVSPGPAQGSPLTAPRDCPAPTLESFELQPADHSEIALMRIQVPVARVSLFIVLILSTTQRRAPLAARRGPQADSHVPILQWGDDANAIVNSTRWRKNVRPSALLLGQEPHRCWLLLQPFDSRSVTSERASSLPPLSFLVQRRLRVSRSEMPK